MPLVNHLGEHVRQELHTYDEHVAGSVARIFCHCEHFWRAVAKYRNETQNTDLEQLAADLLWVEGRPRELIERYIAVAGFELERLEQGRRAIGLPLRALETFEPEEARAVAGLTLMNLGCATVWDLSAPPPTERQRAARYDQIGDSLDLLQRGLEGKCLATNCEANAAKEAYVDRHRSASRAYLCSTHSQREHAKQWTSQRDRVRKLLDDAADVVLATPAKAKPHPVELDAELVAKNEADMPARSASRVGPMADATTSPPRASDHDHRKRFERTECASSNIAPARESS